MLLSIIDDLITDRTAEDLVPGNPKGKYDYIDYNRVGEATNYVSAEIGGLNITAKTDWTNSDIPKESQMTKYRTDIKKIVDRLVLEKPLPTNNQQILTILGANQLEYALKEADSVVQNLMRWSDIDDLNETWNELDAKGLVWTERFIKEI